MTIPFFSVVIDLGRPIAESCKESQRVTLISNTQSAANRGETLNLCLFVSGGPRLWEPENGNGGLLCGLCC